jgi:hypothetical protein
VTGTPRAATNSPAYTGAVPLLSIIRRVSLAAHCPKLVV